MQSVSDLFSDPTEDLVQHSFEDLAHALYLRGQRLGFSKITDKTKWREAVIAEKLGHDVFPKVSAGRHSQKLGADAKNPQTGANAEYKTQAITESQIRNLLGQKKKNGAKYTPLTVLGVYNGAYTQAAIEHYRNIEHYFGVFYQERCLLIIQPPTSTVVDQLTQNLSSKKSGTTNLNTVRITLGVDTYQTVWSNREWFPHG